MLPGTCCFRNPHSYAHHVTLTAALCFRNPHMRTVTNFFIVNLAVADIMVCVICLPPTVLGDVTETWFMGSVMCKIVQYLQVSSSSHTTRIGVLWQPRRGLRPG